VTTSVRTWFGRDDRPPTSGVSPILVSQWIALTCVAGGSPCEPRADARGHTARGAPESPENHGRNRLSEHVPSPAPRPRSRRRPRTLSRANCVGSSGAPPVTSRRVHHRLWSEAHATSNEHPARAAPWPGRSPCRPAPPIQAGRPLLRKPRRARDPRPRGAGASCRRASARRRPACSPLDRNLDQRDDRDESCDHRLGQFDQLIE